MVRTLPQCLVAYRWVASRRARKNRFKGPCALNDDSIRSMSKLENAPVILDHQSMGAYTSLTPICTLVLPMGQLYCTGCIVQSYTSP